jgi:hypothetical protein
VWTLAALRALITIFAIVVASIASRPVTLRTIAAFTTLTARLTVAAILPVLTLLDFLVGALLAVAFELILVTDVIVEGLAALRALLLEAGAAFAENAEIMVRELQIIFGLNAITAELCVARQALVFLEQLGGIAALAIVLTIAVGPSADILGALPTATAPAAALTIIDQIQLPSK